MLDTLNARPVNGALGRAGESAVPIIKSLLPSSKLAAFLIAGAATGLLGVALFGAIHAAIIVPIWTRLFGGIPFGSSPGLL